jgi:serine/threonine-protein kinase RsbW
VPTTYRSAFTSELRNASLARRSIASFATVCGFSDEEVADIRLAAGEALGNAVEHGKSSRSSGFAVRCTFDGSELVIEVRDNGRGFSAPPFSQAGADGRGLGIFLMRRLMDDVSYQRNGTLVRMARKRRNRVEESV